MNLASCIPVWSAVLLGFATAATAGDWPQWRGPHFNGSSDEKNLPASWSKTENIAWSVDLPGPGAGTAIVQGDSVFVSSTDSATKTLQALCLDRRTGKLRWQQKTSDAFGRGDTSNYASPSPATDGKLVVFYYGNGELVAFNLDGQKVWSRNIQKDYGEFAYQWTYGASPLLYGGKLYIQVLQRDVPVHGHGKQNGESYLLALDPTSGKTLWQHVRPSEAKAESFEAYTTPMPFEHNGRWELLVIGGDDLTGHDPATGKELWRWGTWNPTRIGHWRLVPSAVAGDGVVLACAPKGDPIYAIKAGGSGRLDDSAIAWKSVNERALSSDVPTPLFYQGDFFVLGDGRRALSRVEPKTGHVKWSTELPGRKKWEASPTAGDGKIYFMNFAGEAVVVDAEKGAILKVVAMGDEGDDFTRSSIALAHEHLFIRTNKKLYCVGAQP